MQRGILDPVTGPSLDPLQPGRDTPNPPCLYNVYIMPDRTLTPLDEWISRADQALRATFGTPPASRPNPAGNQPEAVTDPASRRHVAGLMRINHAGEVAAQGLYHGQSLTARQPAIRAMLEHAAVEEGDHLAWCKSRLDELGSRTSLLNPLWYAGSVTLGAIAGKLGDRWSLGFMAETERQVEGHLEDHLRRLPADDERSRAILEQMKQDEVEHGKSAIDAGGAPLPLPVRSAMTLVSKVMTHTAYRL